MYHAPLTTPPRSDSGGFRRRCSPGLGDRRLDVLEGVERPVDGRESQGRGGTGSLPRAGHGRPHVVGGRLGPSGGPHRFHDPPSRVSRSASAVLLLTRGGAAQRRGRASRLLVHTPSAWVCRYFSPRGGGTTATSARLRHTRQHARGREPRACSSRGPFPRAAVVQTPPVGGRRRRSDPSRPGSRRIPIAPDARGPGAGWRCQGSLPPMVQSRAAVGFFAPSLSGD